jgi:hypothetical protein
MEGYLPDGNWEGRIDDLYNYLSNNLKSGFNNNP